jgi:hypothetical protein
VWLDNEQGGRIYYFEIDGKFGWKAKYIKEVDKDEVTIRFWQEIYDEKMFVFCFYLTTV